MSDDELEEIRLHDHLRGPAEAARAMLAAVVDDDVETVWSLLTANHKRSLINRWIALERQDDDVIQDLLAEVTLSMAGEMPPSARTEPAASRWAALMAALLSSIRDLVSFDWPTLEAANLLGVASGARPIPPHFESIVFVPIDSERMSIVDGEIPVVSRLTEMEALVLLMEPTEAGWLVDAFSSEPSPQA